MIFWRFLAAKKVNYDEMDGDRLRLPANRNCYRLSRISWALLKFLVLNLSQTGRYLIYLPRRDGRLSWLWCWLYT